jgi:hypothetical protein
MNTDKDQSTQREIIQLTAEELDQVAGGEQISFNFSRIEFNYTAQSASGEGRP